MGAISFKKEVLAPLNKSTYFYVCSWLCRVLVAACGIFRCSMRYLAPQTGVEPGAPALGAWSPSLWTPREVLMPFRFAPEAPQPSPSTSVSFPRAVFPSECPLESVCSPFCQPHPPRRYWESLWGHPAPSILCGVF